MSISVERSIYNKKRYALTREAELLRQAKIRQAPEYKEKQSKRYKLYSLAHKEEQANRMKLFKQSNPDYWNQYNKKRRKEDPLFKLAERLRSRLWHALQATNWVKTTHFHQYIGCTLPQLRNHLEKQFQFGMSWDNHGLWEIDHIKPLSLAVTEKELYELCHYTNLQPLWEPENKRKGNSYEEKA